MFYRCDPDRKTLKCSGAKGGHHVPNKHKDPEAYVHHLLFMFYPFCSEEELNEGEPLSYSAKLLETGAINVLMKTKVL